MLGIACAFVSIDYKALRQPLFLLFIGAVIMIYSQTLLIRASLIRMPHIPNTLPGNLSRHLLFIMI